MSDIETHAARVLAAIRSDVEAYTIPSVENWNDVQRNATIDYLDDVPTNLRDAVIADVERALSGDDATSGCHYSTVAQGERWCDTHDSAAPCPMGKPADGTATVEVTVTPDDLALWDSVEDFHASVRATLRELIADTGDAVVPAVAVR